MSEQLDSYHMMRSKSDLGFRVDLVCWELLGVAVPEECVNTNEPGPVAGLHAYTVYLYAF